MLTQNLKMSMEAEELILLSVCATCVHANSSGNENRIVEVQETINRRENTFGLRSLDMGFCHGQTPLVQDCER